MKCNTLLLFLSYLFLKLEYCTAFTLFWLSHPSPLSLTAPHIYIYIYVYRQLFPISLSLYITHTIPIPFSVKFLFNFPFINYRGIFLFFIFLMLLFIFYKNTLPQKNMKPRSGWDPSHGQSPSIAIHNNTERETTTARASAPLVGPTLPANTKPVQSVTHLWTTC